MAPFNGNGKPDPSTWIGLLYRLAMILAVIYLASQHRHLDAVTTDTNRQVAQVAGVRAP